MPKRHRRGESAGSGAQEGARVGWEGGKVEGIQPARLGPTCTWLTGSIALHPGFGPVSDSLLPPKGMLGSEGKGMDNKRAGLLKDFERQWKNTALLLVHDPPRSTECFRGR